MGWFKCWGLGFDSDFTVVQAIIVIGSPSGLFFGSLCREKFTDN